MNIPEKLNALLREISADLDRTINFWLKYSHDSEYGGFFNCLGERGQVYDDHKYGWLQGRQVWMYAKLYNQVQRFHRQDILEAAVQGAGFLMTKIRYTSETCEMRCYFAVTREGKPVKVQRKIFTECFYIMAMSQMFKATAKEEYRREALGMMKQVVGWVETGQTSPGAPLLCGLPKTNQLAIPMILMCIIYELVDMDASLGVEYDQLDKWCIKQALDHVQRGGTRILEIVTKDGKELSGSQGRLMNPGHAMEVGWFLLRIACRTHDAELRRTVLDKFIDKPFEYGWDQEYGGLFYYLDADGLSPLQLDWSMKLWWPHSEAMIALLMAYTASKKYSYLERFEKVYDYCRRHFVDTENGEWFGYLDRRGEKTHDFKGGPFKGCFHVPRSLMICEAMIGNLLKGK